MDTQPKLPLWRLILGIAILAGFVAVILYLAPVYMDNYRLGRYMQSLAASSPNASDEHLRAQVLDQAHKLDLPLVSGDIQVTHPSGGVHLETKYKVKMDLAVYPVDIHLTARSR